MADTILIVEDEQVLRESLGELLQEEGFEVLLAANGKAAYETLLERPVDLVLSDVRMPEMDGMTLLRHVQRTAPQTPAILITAYGTVSSAVSAMQSGAADYLLKPVQFDDLLAKVRKALEFRKLKTTCRVLTEQVSAEAVFHNLVGQSRQMLQLFELVRKLSTVKSSVLVVGESGTGKELIARAIHYNGITRERPFVPVNCGAIPDTLVESELFGYRRGAFTGAHQDKMGFFEAADGGTLFLDEISTLRPNVQSSLLRALEERVIVPVGDTRPRAVDVRIIAASNRDLEEMVKEGEFREDLLYRLNVVKLVIPPLRERKEDIPLLVHHFLDKHTREMNKTITGVTNGAMRAMLDYDWRGNVRELENVVERAVIFDDQHVRGDAAGFRGQPDRSGLRRLAGGGDGDGPLRRQGPGQARVAGRHQHVSRHDLRAGRFAGDECRAAQGQDRRHASDDHGGQSIPELPVCADGRRGHARGAQAPVGGHPRRRRQRSDGRAGRRRGDQEPAPRRHAPGAPGMENTPACREQGSAQQRRAGPRGPGRKPRAANQGNPAGHGPRCGG